MFRDIDLNNLNESAVKLIGTDWMLITAGDSEKYNTMTAAWGGLGFLWKLPVSYIFIRPTRYTYDFVENSPYFSVCFFDDNYRDALNYCGSVSGRQENKALKTGLIPKNFDNKTIYFEQSRLVLICRKLYYSDLDPQHFIDPTIEKLYPAKDYHRMYIGAVENAFIKE
jgi:flavin reductase (DIM6/NTAB) family NADH-FMN oxidoreductase RutF